MTTDETVTRLAAREEVKELRYAYGHHLDNCEWGQ